MKRRILTGLLAVIMAFGIFATAISAEAPQAEDIETYGLIDCIHISFIDGRHYAYRYDFKHNYDHTHCKTFVYRAEVCSNCGHIFIPFELFSIMTEPCQSV